MRKKATFNLNEELLEDLRDAAVWLRNTITGIAEEGLRRELTRLEKKFNQGAKFPARKSQPRVGRPIK